MADQSSYTTIRALGEDTYEEKKSVFIGRAMPVKTEAEALAFLASVRAEFPDARHHVYAYVLRDNGTTRYSDDREPQGTAGLPVLDVLRKAEITDAAIVVVRYFGGTLLGTGGLVRAYTKAASGAVLAAGVVLCTKLTTLLLDATYADYQKILPLFERKDLTVESTDFSDRVQIRFSLPTTEREALLHRVTEATFGRATVTEQGERYGFL